jgi:hypothetical protein
MSAPLRIEGPESNRERTRMWIQATATERGERAGAGPPSPPRPTLNESSYAERLIKLIPAEVVAIYLFGVGTIPSDNFIAILGWSATCLALVVIARAFATRDAAQHLPPQWAAVSISCVSFLIWIFTMPGPLQGFGVLPSFVGSLVIAVWTFVVPYFYKG